MLDKEPAPPVTHSSHQRRTEGWVLAALMCAMMLAAMDTTIVSTAIPQIVTDVGGLRLFSWVFSIYLLAQTVTIPIYGKLSDLFGRKRVLIVGTVIFILGSVLSAAAWDMLSLIVFRGIQGLGAGSIMATVMTLAGDLYPPERQAWIQGWLNSVWGVAAIVGPLMGGAFAEYMSWRWIFLINLPLGGLALILIGGCLHEHFQPRRPRIDYAGSALALGATGALIFGVLQGGQAWPWLSTPSLATFGLAMGLTAIAVVVERHAAEPVLPGWLWRRRTLATSNLAMLGMGIAIMAPYTYLPTYLQAVHGLGAIGAGLVLASMSIGWPLGAVVSGHIYTRIGYRDTALIGAALIVVSPLAFALLPGPHGTALVLAEQVVLGLGLGLLTTPIIVGVQASVGWAQRGVVTGANMFARYLGQSLGAALFGAIFNSVVGTRLAAAPAALASQLPTSGDVLTALNAPGTPRPVLEFLRATVDVATRNLYFAMGLVAILTLIAVVLAPRHFPRAPRD